MKGKFEPIDKSSPFPTSGLFCVTCLIGVYSMKSGQPLIGVINQPFHSKVKEDEYTGHCYWGFDLNGYRLNNLEHLEQSSQLNSVVVSGSESRDVLINLRSKFDNVVETVGAGYKLLCVATGSTAIFVTSKGSTYRWDTCGPHALLKSLGGNLVEFSLIDHVDEDEVNYEMIAKCEIRYNVANECSEGAEQWANQMGLIAFKEISGIRKVASCLK